MALDRNKLGQVFLFLERNRSWNEFFQRAEYRRTLAHCESPRDRLLHLLHATVNTQSQPKMTPLGKFWRRLDAFRPKGKPTLAQLTEHLEAASSNLAKSHGPWDRLFQALTVQPGWGPKTAALFVKNVIKVHRGPAAFRFLHGSKDAELLSASDRIYLPVDAVIIRIFQCLGSASPTFASINRELNDYKAEQMLSWDDLWYWGFFTQKSNQNARSLEWNQDKFWCQIAAPVNSEADVKRLAGQFIQICTKP